MAQPAGEKYWVDGYWPRDYWVDGYWPGVEEPIVEEDDGGSWLPPELLESLGLGPQQPPKPVEPLPFPFPIYGTGIAAIPFIVAKGTVQVYPAPITAKSAAVLVLLAGSGVVGWGVSASATIALEQVNGQAAGVHGVSGISQSTFDAVQATGELLRGVQAVGAGSFSLQAQGQCNYWDATNEELMELLELISLTVGSMPTESERVPITLSSPQTTEVEDVEDAALLAWIARNYLDGTPKE